VEEDAHEGPDAAGEVDLAVGDDGAAAQGPGVDHARVAEDGPRARGGFEAPEETAGGCVEGVKITVVGADEETALVISGGRAADGTLGEETPYEVAVANVIGGDGIVERRGDDHVPVDDDRVIERIILEAILVGPGGFQRGKRD